MALEAERTAESDLTRKVIEEPVFRAIFRAASPGNKWPRVGGTRRRKSR
jgi:hypothetical protein